MTAIDWQWLQGTYLPGHTQLGDLSSWHALCPLCYLWALFTIVKLGQLHPPAQTDTQTDEEDKINDSSTLLLAKMQFLSDFVVFLELSSLPASLLTFQPPSRIWSLFNQSLSMAFISKGPESNPHPVYYSIKYYDSSKPLRINTSTCEWVDSYQT